VRRDKGFATPAHPGIGRAAPRFELQMRDICPACAFTSRQLRQLRVPVHHARHRRRRRSAGAAAHKKTARRRFSQHL